MSRTLELTHGPGTGKGPAGEMLVEPGWYSSAPLVKDIDMLCDPNVEVTDRMLVNMVVKYFYAYVMDGAQDARVPLSDITWLFELFSRHLSLSESGDDLDLMNVLRRLSVGLELLADAPRAAHLAGMVIRSPLPGDMGRSRYVGLDVGAASGLLLLAQYILARRNRFESISALGLEPDPIVAGHSSLFCRRLQAGVVMNADICDPATYGGLKGRGVSFVSNQALTSLHQHLPPGEFCRASRAMFSALAGDFARTVFFPEALFAYEREQNVSVILTRSNAFMGPGEYSQAQLSPQGFICDGTTVALHTLGRPYAHLFTPQGLAIMKRRW